MDNEKFAPRIDNTKTEKTGRRPDAYSLWHREFGSEYYSVDVDYIEYRKGRGIVAFIAVSGECVDEGHILNSKKYIWERTKLERQILTDLSKQCNVPAFFVVHTTDLSLFHVHNLNQDLSKYNKMSKDEYEKFIKSL